MKFVTELGEKYRMTPIDTTIEPPLYFVEKHHQDEETEYIADLIAPRRILVGIGVHFLIRNTMDADTPYTTSPVATVSGESEYEPSISERIVDAIDCSPFDFRTPESLAKELCVDEKLIHLGLRALEGVVRRPLFNAHLYPNYYRLIKKGPTREEKMRGY